MANSHYGLAHATVDIKSLELNFEISCGRGHLKMGLEMGKAPQDVGMRLVATLGKWVWLVHGNESTSLVMLHDTSDVMALIASWHLLL